MVGPSGRFSNFSHYQVLMFFDEGVEALDHLWVEVH
jgi:hypothetical protein